MKKLIQFSLISMALLLGITAKAQNQSVIADGTVISPYVPLSGAFMSWNQRIQIIYPASEIPQTLAGHEITKMIFHSQNATVNWGQATAVHIKLMHTSASNLATDWENTSSATTVCTGVPLAISGNQVVFNFTTSFIYSGGNLLLEIETTPGITNNANFFGKNSPVTNVRVQFSTALNTLSFLPKLTIEHAPAICTVTFNKNSTTATGTMASQIFTGGVPQNLNTNTFSLPGHTFAGWATSPNGGVVYADGVSYTAVGNATLYAVWNSFVWLLSGNAGTDPAVDFIGTTDNQAFKIKTNNGLNMFFEPTGKVGIRTDAPQANLHLHSFDRCPLGVGGMTREPDDSGKELDESERDTGELREKPIYCNSFLMTNSNTTNGFLISQYIKEISLCQRENANFNLFGTEGKGITIAPNGDVGIGTTNPQSKLAVNGLITAKDVSVTLTGWPDFVLENNYPLMSLQETEAFIKEKKHLPNVPTATEAETEGIKIGEMNKILLQKIEEMMLHIINLQKQIDELKQKGVE